jgi:hypothetical protein
VAWLVRTQAGWLLVGLVAAVLCFVLGVTGVWPFGLVIGCGWLALVAWNAFEF